MPFLKLSWRIEGVDYSTSRRIELVNSINGCALYFGWAENENVGKYEKQRKNEYNENAFLFGMFYQPNFPSSLSLPFPAVNSCIIIFLYLTMFFENQFIGKVRNSEKSIYYFGYTCSTFLFLVSLNCLLMRLL